MTRQTWSPRHTLLHRSRHRVTAYSLVAQSRTQALLMLKGGGHHRLHCLSRQSGELNYLLEAEIGVEGLVLVYGVPR